METLAWLFVAKPFNILLVALVLVVLYFVLRRVKASSIGKRPSLLIAATAWGLYAAWEWWVNTSSPEADIRVDLLLIWPVLAILTLWALYRALR